LLDNQLDHGLTLALNYEVTCCLRTVFFSQTNFYSQNGKGVPLKIAHVAEVGGLDCESDFNVKRKSEKIGLSPSISSHHSFAATNCQNHLKSIFLEFMVIQGHRCWHS